MVLCSDAAAGSTPFAVSRKEGEIEVLRCAASAGNRKLSKVAASAAELHRSLPFTQTLRISDGFTSYAIFLRDNTRESNVRLVIYNDIHSSISF